MQKGPLCTLQCLVRPNLVCWIWIKALFYRWWQHTSVLATILRSCSSSDIRHRRIMHSFRIRRNTKRVV